VCDQDWLRAENLLPHQTVEKLTKWTVYDDGGQARTVPADNGRGPWESEDPTQEMLESRLVSTKVSIDMTKSCWVLEVRRHIILTVELFFGHISFQLHSSPFSHMIG